jgi:hypothetical protein
MNKRDTNKPHKQHTTLSPCDGNGSECPTDNCNGCPGCDGGWLITFCCEIHARLAGSVDGANVAYPNDGPPYARTSEASYYTIEKELSEHGFTVQEVG